MKRTLIWSDSHICKENIKELNEIFSEILSFDADRVICLGDYYERKVLGDEELIFGTHIAKKFVDKYPEVYIIEGNHDKNTIKYLKDVGAKVVDNIVIDDNYYGHFFVEQSIKSFNSAKVKLSDLEKYNYVFLGHQHSFQSLGSGRFHPGSISYIDFGEVEDISKYIIILEDNEINFVELKTPIPMRDVFNRKDLDDINKRTKVRYVIKDFNQLKKETNILEEYKNKFYQFKLKLDFENKQEEIEISPSKNIEDIIKSWLEKIEDKEVKEELILIFKEEER